MHGRTILKRNPGYEHQRQRKHIQPAFSTRFIRATAPTFNQVALEVAVHVILTCEHADTETTSAQLVDVLREVAQEKPTEVDISNYLGRFSLESVGRASLGYSFGPLNHHGTDYSRAMKQFGLVPIFILSKPKLTIPTGQLWSNCTCGADSFHGSLKHFLLSF